MKEIIYILPGKLKDPKFAGILAENIRRAGEGRELLHRLC
jgi:hypothetical protein